MPSLIWEALTGSCTSRTLLQSAGVWGNNYSIRQDRSGKDAGKADNQSIIECRTELSDFKQLGLFPKMAIKLYRYDSLQIAKQLGLVMSNNNVLDPIFRIRFMVDFDIKVLRTLSTRCGSAVNTGHSRACLQLFGEGIDLTFGTLKRQLIVTRNIARKLADGHCHPKHYSDELKSGFANVKAYYATLGEFTVEGVSHLLGR